MAAVYRRITISTPVFKGIAPRYFLPSTFSTKHFLEGTDLNPKN
jgi:hypothetical protein